MGFRSFIDTLLRNPSGRMWVQIFRYLVSGSVAFLVDAGLLALLTELFGDALLLLWTGISFAVGLVITYLFSILWVFDNRSLDNKAAEFSVFVLIGVCGLALTELFMWVFTSKCGLHYMISKICTTVIVFVWNFAAKKSLLFRAVKR